MSIEKVFGFNTYTGHDKPFGLCKPTRPEGHAQITDLMKRVKRSHPMATFKYLGGISGKDRSWASDTILIQLSPESLCFDAKVTCYSRGMGTPKQHHYQVATVSTHRSKAIPYEFRNTFNIAWGEGVYTTLTASSRTAARAIKNTKSFTARRVVEDGIHKNADIFTGAMSNVQKKLSRLQRETFSSMGTSDKDEALLEYCLSTMQNRTVRADIAEQVTDKVKGYLARKEELGASTAVCADLQPLGLYKVQGIDRVYYHRQKFVDDPREAIPYVDDLKDLPEEVLSKLATMQAVGEEAMDTAGWSSCKVLDGVGAIRRPSEDSFLEAIQCVFVSPETMQEVSCLANNTY